MKRNDILTPQIKEKIYEGWKSSAFDFLKKATNDATHKIDDIPKVDSNQLNTFTSKFKRKIPSLTLNKQIRDNAQKHIDDTVDKIHGPQYKVLLDKEDAGLLNRIALKKAQAQDGLEKLIKNRSSIPSEQYNYAKIYYTTIINVSTDRMESLIKYSDKVRKPWKELKKEPRQDNLF